MPVKPKFILRQSTRARVGPSALPVYSVKLETLQDWLSTVSCVQGKVTSPRNSLGETSDATTAA